MVADLALRMLETPSCLRCDKPLLRTQADACTCERPVFRFPTSDDAALMKAGMAASVALLDRGWGRPMPQVAVAAGGHFSVLYRNYRPGVDPLADASKGEQTLGLPEREVTLPRWR
jgi:hypothetical protein